MVTASMEANKNFLCSVLTIVLRLLQYISGPASGFERHSGTHFGKLFSQIGNVDPYRAYIRFGVIPPDLFQQILGREIDSFIENKGDRFLY